jgi:hypothetical protein
MLRTAKFRPWMRSSLRWRWGCGPIGYGPFRAARVLRENPQASATLRRAAQVLRRDGGAAAFAWFKRHRLHQLGVSFATKYLYFCNGPDAPPALILDTVVQRWLRRHADFHTSLNWHVADYTKYLQLATVWAEELGIAPDEAEYLIFSDSLLEEPGGSPWALRLPTSPEFDQEDMSAVLEALDDVGQLFAALPGTSPTDLDDFERGLRQLRRIVLTAAASTHTRQPAGMRAAKGAPAA